MSYNIPSHLIGLSDAEVAASQKKNGFNKMHSAQKSSWFQLLLNILKEPMLLLLFAISAIYLIVQDYGEAAFMFVAIVAVSAISFYQDNRSKKALEALEKLNEPLSTVIRNSKVIQIPTHEIAVGDLCIIEEGKMINADGKIVHSNDFSVNEASLTGEAFSVFKSADTEDRNVYSGTVVVSGLAVFEVEQTGAQTKLGKIGASIQEIQEENSPLHQQISKFVKGMAIIGSVVFLLVWAYSYWQSRNLVESLLAGLTLAMSILPEEIPVAFTTFMALGAWKLMQEGVIIKRSSVVETLGSTTVICTDKTGTITENTMELKALFNFRSGKIFEADDFNDPALSELIQFSMWSSEPLPFDPMEKTLHKVYEKTESIDARKEFHMIHEYPLDGKPPMMTHIFENAAGVRVIAAKGAPEAILHVSHLSNDEKKKLRQYIKDFGKKGYRLLGVAKSDLTGTDFPEKQQDFNFEFLGFTVFYDPPKKGIQQVFQHIYDAGIKVKIITGDSEDTTNAIALQAGVINNSPAVNGADIVNHSETELIELSRKTTLFTRMFPEAKLKMVNALKSDGEVVAMLGDGVNDAPALKSAHIGVAMGNKGTEIAKAAATLVIVNDDLDKLVLGIAAGRRIYTNIKKAVQYIISIHIPIILTVSLPLFLGWIYPHIFTPVHVIFLELIMGPTCSIVYENEPMEKNTMQQKPRKLTDTFLSWKELSLSIIQGLMIAAGVLFAYQFAVQKGGDELTTRAMVFTTLIFANILLSLTNRSFSYSILDTLKYKNKLFPLVIGITLVLLASILYIRPIAAFFQVLPLDLSKVGIAFSIATGSVLWFEIYKWLKGKSKKNSV
ncbi:cation-translocating P-type ATPase [Kaistella daneshvariae]|uniref:Cation-translocating P-type ATPase n=1 Tax=Kaistella daneshvariae TaxID=2487074 RepID=A0ABM7C9A9_9FLAO|nr:cation-translocating P-type ATPase [Kaistella daneshvariae]AZI67582.1 cation-translocating P-type ATPase [Kaistella daneshvariae]